MSHIRTHCMVSDHYDSGRCERVKEASKKPATKAPVPGQRKITDIFSKM